MESLFLTPVKRKDLPSVLNCSNDRLARIKLERLQQKYNIINLQDGRGYFLATDKQAIEYAEQEMRRAVSIFNKAREIIKRCELNGYKVPVKAHFRRLTKTPDKNQISFAEVKSCSADL